jgi:hypothetical protein
MTAGRGQERGRILAVAGFGIAGQDHRSHGRPGPAGTDPGQTSSRFPLHICGVKPTVPGGSPTVPIRNGIAVLYQQTRDMFPSNLLLLLVLSLTHNFMPIGRLVFALPA